MNRLSFAGLASLASLGVQAQGAPSLQFQPSLDPVIVTATRSLNPVATLRDAVVITREDLEASGSLSLAEVLQRRAGIEIRPTGGPGQPQTLFIRGAGSAQTLVLVDGLRVGSATIGTTSIEHIPLELIERVEVVKGPMSSLYGPEAIGGVIQIFTRGKGVPHLFVATGYGTDNDRRFSAGLSTADDDTRVALSTGVRAVDARSATNPRATFSYNPDRDPYRNAFANLHVAQRLWQGETLELEAFTSRSRTDFDSGPDTNDRSEQSISGARLGSSTHFMPWWASKVSVGEGRDRLIIRGSFPSHLETRQDQASWVNEFTIARGTLLAGAETLRQRIVSDASSPFSRTRRDTNSGFLGLNESLDGQRLEASVRRDDDDQFGKRNTGAASYGWEFPSVARITATYARGFRAPTFFDLYGPSFEGYSPNPELRPERSKSYELAVKSDPAARLQWRVTAFDNRLEDLIVYSFAQGTVLNVARARVRGVEAAFETQWLETRWRATFNAQRPRDEDTGKRLQGRAEHFGTFEATRSFGSWTAGVAVLASGARFDSTDESPASRLGGHAVVDARLRYTLDKRWSAELAATNLGDRKYESAVGYDAPRRSILLSLRFESY